VASVDSSRYLDMITSAGARGPYDLAEMVNGSLHVQRAISKVSVVQRT
jgi:hypothetical protein